MRNVRRGLYAAGSKREFEPAVSKELAGLSKKLRKRFPYLESLCVWDSRWLNEFTVQQALSSMVIIETERGTENSVFEFAKLLLPGFHRSDSEREDNYSSGARSVSL